MQTTYSREKDISARSNRMVIQPSLELGKPNDIYEKQAELMAKRVMMQAYNEEDFLQMKSFESEGNEGGGLQVHPMKEEQQQKIQKKNESLEEARLQTKSFNNNSNTAITSELSSRILSTKGNGKALESNVQREMGTKIGADFSKVNIHNDSKAAELSSEIGAKAFTVGSDIYFNKGQYEPNSFKGKHLLAHELTHVVQQGNTANDHGRSNAFNHFNNGYHSTHYNTGVFNKDINQFRASNHYDKIASQQSQIIDNSLTGNIKKTSNVSRIQRSCGCSGSSPSSSSSSSSSSTSASTPSASPSIPAARIERVAFSGNHSLTPFGADNKSNPIWTRGSIDHAVAYSKGSSPNYNAEFEIINNPLPSPVCMQIPVRVKEGSTILEQGFANVSGNHVSISGQLNGLSDSLSVSQREYNLSWEATFDNNNWITIANSGLHKLYWLHGTPRELPTRTLAVNRATSYATGNTDVISAIRSGIRGDVSYDPSDSINPDPLTVLNDPMAICTDFANLLTLLARSIGYNANSVMFWGGFESKGKPIWVTLDSSYVNLVNVRPIESAYNPPNYHPLSPHGWAFNYHAISRIEGALHDAALNRPDYDAEAVHAGKMIRLVDFSSITIPTFTKNQFVSHQMERNDHIVAVTLKNFPAYIRTSDFNTIYPLQLPLGFTSPYDAPVIWSLVSGNLPPGMILLPYGLLIGMPFVEGSYPLTVRAEADSSLYDEQNIQIEVDLAP